MDDTLAFERDYVRSGFTSVANYCSEASTVYRQEVFNFLMKNFADGVRSNAFNLLLEKFSVLAQDTSVEVLVDVYRTHQPQVNFAPGIEELLNTLKDSGVRMAVISDGPLASQSAKAEVLGLVDFCDPVILTDHWGREFWKPHHRAFEKIESKWGIAEKQRDGLVYIGDNPAKDFLAPNQRGWQSARLRLGEQLRFLDEAESAEGEAKFDFSSVSDLASWLLDKLA